MLLSGIKFAALSQRRADCSQSRGKIENRRPSSVVIIADENVKPTMETLATALADSLGMK